MNVKDLVKDGKKAFLNTYGTARLGIRQKMAFYFPYQWKTLKALRLPEK